MFLSNSLTANNNRRIRSTSGQGLIESSCGLIIFLMVAIGLFLGFLDVYAVMVNTQKVKLAADSAAKVCNDGRFWLGTYRPDFNSEAAQARATATANYILRAQGLGDCQVLAFEPGNPVRENGQYFVCSHIRIRVPGLRLPFAAVGIPGVIDLTADGYSAESSFTPYATMVFGFTDIGQTDAFGRPSNPRNLTRRIQLPVIGYGSQTGDGGLSGARNGTSGSAVPGGRYVGAEARIYGALSGDTLTQHDVSSGSDVQTPLSW